MSRLMKTAGKNKQEVHAAICKVIEDQILIKIKEIGWKDGTDGILELVDAYMDADFSVNVEMIVEAITSSVEDWADATKENFPNGAE